MMIPIDAIAALCVGFFNALIKKSFFDLDLGITLAVLIPFSIYDELIIKSSIITDEKLIDYSILFLNTFLVLLISYAVGYCFGCVYMRYRSLSENRKRHS